MLLPGIFRDCDNLGRTCIIKNASQSSIFFVLIEVNDEVFLLFFFLLCRSAFLFIEMKEAKVVCLVEKRHIQWLFFFLVDFVFFKSYIIAATTVQMFGISINFSLFDLCVLVFLKECL